jgi:uracil DNA glycosylase/ribonuclease HI
MSSRSKSIITEEHVNKMFSGIRPGWRNILLGPIFKSIISDCLHKLNLDLQSKGVSCEQIARNGLAEYIRPQEKNIFEAMKYFDPNNLRGVIVGQDPYPAKKAAQGLCFSAPKDVPTPKSLIKIYDCLLHNELIVSRPNHGNLVGWAKQGWLLLNKYLTRSPNIESTVTKAGVVSVCINGDGGSQKKNMHLFWEEFTGKLLLYLTGDFLREINHPRHEILVFLWGGEAQKMTKYIHTEGHPEGKSVRLMTWGHPSSINQHNMKESDPENFKFCDHFSQALWMHWDPNFDIGGALLDQFYLARQDPGFKFELRPGCYSDGTNTEENRAIREAGSTMRIPTAPRALPIVAAIDGGCRGNGKSDARAGFGIYFPAKFNGRDNAAPSAKYYGSLPRFTLEASSNDLVRTAEAIPCRNGRAEFLAMIHAMRIILGLIREQGYRPVIIINDATYISHHVNEWTWKHWRKSKDFSTIKANQDLAKILHQLLLNMVEFVPKLGGREDPQNTLMQPAARTNYASPQPMDLNWKGLTMVHQDSHIPESQAPPEGTIEHDMWLCNKVADELIEHSYQLDPDDAELHKL